MNINIDDGGADVGATPASTTITPTTGTDNKKVLQELDANKIIIDSNEVQLLQKCGAFNPKFSLSEIWIQFASPIISHCEDP